MSSVTVQKAIQQLKDKGLVIGRPGRGLVVADRTAHPETGLTDELWVESLEIFGDDTAMFLNKFAADFPSVTVHEHASNNDLCCVDAELLPTLADSLEDVTELAEESYGRGGEGQDSFAALRAEGRLHMFPAALNAWVMACNVDVFERFGVPLPSMDWSWDDFVRLGQMLTRESEGQYGLINTKDPWQSLIPLLWAEGGAIFSEDGERCLLDSLVAVRAAQLVRRTAEFSLPAGGLTPWECWDAFAAGRAALIACGTYGYQYFNKLGVRWVARPLPHGKHRAGAVRVLGFGLSRRAMHRPAAVEFLRAIADYELWPARRVQPVALPLHKELERDGETERVYRRALTYGRTILSDIAPQYRNKIHAQALAIIEKYHMPLLVHGQAPVEEIMWSMSREANRMISIAAKSREEVL